MYLSIKIIIILLQQYLEKFWMHHQHSSKESLFPVALRQLLDIVYHCSEQNGASRPVMTPGPYFRWAFVVLCPMRVWNTEAAAVRQPRTFRAPCHPLGRAATRAWRRVPPPLIADASHLWCNPATVAAVEPPVGHRTEALEKCVTHLLISEFWESEMRKHLMLREKVKWGYGELVAVASEGIQNSAALLF